MKKPGNKEGETLHFFSSLSDLPSGLSLSSSLSDLGVDDRVEDGVDDLVSLFPHRPLSVRMMALFWDMNIYLIGMRGVGKSTIGQLLSEKTGRDFADMDAVIEKKIGKSVSDIVKESGWDTFRKYEKEAVDQLAGLENLVIGTGGGVLMYFENAEKLKSSGKIILLRAELETLQNRLAQANDRPSLTGKGFLEELDQIWNERKDRYYQFADQLIDTDGKKSEEIVQEIMREL